MDIKKQLKRTPKWLPDAITISVVNIVVLTLFIIIWSLMRYERWDEYIPLVLIWFIPSTILLFIGIAVKDKSRALAYMALFLGVGLSIITAAILWLGIIIISIG